MKQVGIFLSGFLCIFLVWTMGMTTKVAVMSDQAVQKPTKPNAGRDYDKITEFKTETTPVKNIYFMKIHKTGTTTLFGIFSRYAMKHNLRVTIFDDQPEYGDSEGLFKFLTPPFTEGKSTKYNMVLDHSKYYPGTIKKILNKPTTYVTLLRNPLVRLNSILNKKVPVARKLKLKKTNLVASFIEKVEDKSIDKDLYRHNMSDVFRIDSKDLGKDKTFRELEKVFLVMITEYYDESMILMRRRFGWTFRDVLYLKVNVQGYEHKPLDETLYQRFCKWEWADCKLYEHFNRTFWNNFHFHGDSITREVSHYKKVQQEIAEFCSPVVQFIKEKRPLDTIKVLEFAGSEWHEPFTYNSIDCALNIVHPRTVRAYLFHKQNPEQACDYSKGKHCTIIFDEKGTFCNKICQISKQHSDVFGEILNITRSNYESNFFKLD